MLRETMVLDEDERAGAAPSVRTKQLVLVVLSGAHVGERFVLEESRATLGRGPTCDIVLEDEGVSREHAVLERGSTGYAVRDLHSTNGVFVNGARTSGTALEPGDRIGIGADTVLKLQLEDDLEAELEGQILSAATRDGLTGARNRLTFDRELAREVARAIRHRSPLSLLMFDLDHFKAVNDTYGHPAGDQVLRELVARLDAVTRSEDSLARVGGEEFVILCAGTQRDEAVTLAERARQAIRCEPFVVGSERLPITTSIGVAELLELDEPTADALFEASDAALYHAKKLGRDRVETTASPRG